MPRQLLLSLLVTLALLPGARQSARAQGGAAPATTATLSGFCTLRGGGSASATPQFTNAVSVSLSAVNADGSRGVASTLYTLDGSAPLTYLAPFAVATAGPHLLTFWSVDAEGDAEAAHAQPFGIFLPPAPTLKLTSSGSPARAGQPVTLTATLAPPAGASRTPTGTVTFYDGAAVLGAATVGAGSASLTTSGLGIGSHTLTAVYSGDANFARSTSPALAQTVTGIRIMPMGDGLTVGYSTQDPTVAVNGGYRGPLYAQTAGQGWAVQYVGSRVQGLGIGACEGHEGWGTVLALSREPAFVTQYQPDVILLMSGVDDLELKSTGAQALSNMGALLDALSAAKPGVQIVVASLTPFTYYRTDPAQTAAYNAGLPAAVQQAAGRGDNVSFVDMHNLCGIGPADFPTGDTVHPKESGYAKMATVWYNALAALPLAR